MSGPQGYDPTQPWQPQQQPGQAEQQAAAETQWASSPAYPPAQYPQQPAYPAAPQYPGGAPAYGQPDQYGQQYGQPGQQPGPYGQPGQYGQAGAYGQFPQQSGGKSKGLIIGGVLAALAALAVLITGFWLPGFFVTTKLDINKAQDGVQQILSDDTNGYGAKNVKDVKCNDGVDPKVKKNDTFDCEVSIDGTKRKVTVTFRDDSGTYEVGRPN